MTDGAAQPSDLAAQDEDEARSREGPPPVGPAGFVRALLARGERRAVPLPLTRRPAPGGAPRVRWIAEALRRDALGWLVRRGGWRRRLVVAGGRRREGRVSDAGIYERLDVRFTALPLRLVVAAIEEAGAGLPAPPPELEAAARGGALAAGDLLAVHRLVAALCAASGATAGPRGGPEGEVRALVDALRRELGDVAVVGRDGRPASSALPPPAPEVAERLRQPDAAGAASRGPLALPGSTLWIAELPPSQALAVARVPGDPRRGAADPWQRAGVGERLARLGRALASAPAAARARSLDARRKALVLASPLTLAHHLELLGELATGDGPEGLTPAVARLGPVLGGERALLATYLDRALAEAWLEEDAARRRLPAPEAQARWVAAGRGLLAWVRACRDRPDALRPVLGFLRAYLRRHGNRAPLVEALRVASRAYDRASERDAFLAAAARLFAAGREVGAVAERVLAAPVVDRTEAEKVFLGEWHEGLRGPLQDELEAIRRELAGEVG